MSKIFYDQDGIIVRRSIITDVEQMKNNLRQSDVNEVMASHNKNPEESLKDCVQKSIFCCTIEREGKAIGIFGINPESILGNKATIFMLATPCIDKIQKRFIRNSRKFIRIMLEWYSTLENWVDVRNKKSIAWLKFCGANMGEIKNIGPDNMPFQYFSFKRG